jgi:hypothetical protein
MGEVANAENTMPQTDEQAERALRSERHPSVGARLVRLYRRQRAKGDTVEQAYKAVRLSDRIETAKRDCARSSDP